MSNLPNYTYVKLGVVMDDDWIRKIGATSDQLEEVITSAVATADDESFQHGEMSIEWIGVDQDPTDYGASM